MSIDCYLLKTSPNNRIRIFGELGFVEYLIEMAESEYSNNLDLGESWAAIHYMLTIEVPTTRPSARLLGIQWWDDSLENVLMGGENTPYECAFEFARYIEPTDVLLMAEKLNQVSVDKFIRAYDPDYMEEIGIPPSGWKQDTQTMDWLVQKFLALKSFYQIAATNHESIIIYFL